MNLTLRIVWFSVESNHGLTQLFEVWVFGLNCRKLSMDTFAPVLKYND